MKNRSFALTCTVVRSSVLKPCMLTRSTYSSGRTIGKTKRPSASVVAVRVLACVLLVSATVAPGRTPPWASFTWPATDALVVWAATGAAASRQSPAATAHPMARRPRSVMRMNPSLSFLRGRLLVPRSSQVGTNAYSGTVVGMSRNVKPTDER